jgi:hypothetical protein
VPLGCHYILSIEGGNTHCFTLGIKIHVLHRSSTILATSTDVYPSHTLTRIPSGHPFVFDDIDDSILDEDAVVSAASLCIKRAAHLLGPQKCPTLLVSLSLPSVEFPLPYDVASLITTEYIQRPDHPADGFANLVVISTPRFHWGFQRRMIRLIHLPSSTPILCSRPSFGC